MWLFIAQEEGPLETVRHFSAAVAGAELNVAIGLSRLGHSVGYLTKLGNDLFAKKIIILMQQNGIDTSLVSYSDTLKTGFMFKSRVSVGDPEVYYQRKGSAASTLSEKDIDGIDFSQYKYLHLTGILPALSDTALDATKYLVKKAKDNKLTIFFDPNIRLTLWPNKNIMVDTINELALYADYFLPGIKEGTILTGLNTPEEVADYYLNRGVSNVIIKVGPKGAYLAADGQRSYLPTFEIERIVDTVGAGDGFAAGVISAVMEGLSLPEAVNRGNAIGSIQVMSEGDNDGLPIREELNKFIKEHKLMQ